MPTVTRQRPGANGSTFQPAPADSDDVLGSGIAVSDIKSILIKMLVYGQNGTGKTRFACTFPKPLVLVSFEPQDEGGALSVTHIPGIKFVRPRTIERTVKLAAQLAKKPLCDLPDPAYNGKPYQSVVFDSVTSYQNILLQELMGWDVPAEQVGFGDVPPDIYRRRAEEIKQYLRAWIDLPYHTVFTGKEKDHNPPKEEKVNERTGKVSPDMRPKFVRGLQQESVVSVDLGGGAAGWLIDAVPYFGRLYMDREVVARKQKGIGDAADGVRMVETGRFIRALRCSYHPNFVSRFQSAEEIPDEIIHPDYNRVAAVIAGKPMHEPAPATRVVAKPPARPGVK